jgi:hypothetical protein
VIEIDVGFCFYDDPRYVRDADRDSSILKDWHRYLWSKQLPDGNVLDWKPQPGEYLTYAAPHGPLRVSSDTIATTHSNYKRHGAARLYADLDPVSAT